MALVPAICTQCGGEIQIDTNKVKMFCMHCGTPFIVSDMIGNDNHSVKVFEATKYKITELKDYCGALDALKGIENEACNQGEYWWLFLMAKTWNFKTFDDLEDVLDSFEIINRVARLSGLSKEQTDSFLGYLNVVKKQAEHLSRHYVKLDKDLEFQTWAINNYISLFQRRNDEAGENYYKGINKKLEEKEKKICDKANMYYKVYSLMSKSIKTYEESKTFNCERFYVPQSSCWEDFR